MLFPWLISGVSFVLFLLFQVTGIYAGDSGDLVTAASIGGVPHPPGYPLYTLLGFWLSKIPLFTISWRVTLLSSVSQAITVGLVYAIVFRLMKNKFASVFAALLLVGNYLFFLYSVTPEVFALFDAFVAAIVCLLVRLTERFSWRVVWVLTFIFGLSLSHHHVILFLIPVLVYWFVGERRRLQAHPRFLIIALLLLVVGLLPYVYLPIAARSEAIINWNRPVDLAHFVRLVTRADYGTFVSGGAFAPELLPRLIAVKAYGQFLLLDFGWPIILTAAAGLGYLLVNRRKTAITTLLAFVFLGPLFFFYASFPLVSRFSLGTYERFLLPSYLLVAVWAGVGVFHLVQVAQQTTLARFPKRLLQGALGVFLLVIVGISLFQTLWRFWGIRTDKTAEYLAVDILSSVPRDAVVLLAYDTPLFTTQYVRYALNFREDVRVIHASRLNSPDYQTVLRARFPELVVPTETGSGFAGKFVEANVGRAPIFTNVPFPVGPAWYWVPHGLLYQAVSSDQLPTVDDMYAVNQSLWRTFHDPRSGILSRYPHLMLSDVLDQYAAGRLALGKTLLRAAKYPEAKEEFEQAVSLGADTKEVDALLLLGIAQTYLKECEMALATFQQAERVSISPDTRIPLYQSLTLRDCLGDPKKADELFSEYQKARQALEPPLEAPR